jgi:prepilin-type N-terminal cleavage/methylation domain-containing protein
MAVTEQLMQAEENGRVTSPRRDRGFTFVEILVSIVLLGTVVVGVLTAVRATIIGTTIERDHSKAQQWLQSAVGVIEAYNFANCDTLTISGAAVEAEYQAAIDNVTTGAKRPYGFTSATIDVKTPEVWDGTKFVAFATQTTCYDQFLLRQQLVTIEVSHPSGIVESVEMVKRDR